MNKQICLSFDSDLIKDVKKMCIDREETFSNIVQRLLKQEVYK